MEYRAEMIGRLSDNLLSERHKATTVACTFKLELDDDS